MAAFVDKESFEDGARGRCCRAMAAAARDVYRVVRSVEGERLAEAAAPVDSKAASADCA
jgi:hypothetical protein